MGWTLSKDKERMASLDELSEADIITLTTIDNLIARHIQSPDEREEESRIVIPAPGEIFEITVDKGVDQHKEDGKPWYYFNSEVNSKNYPRKSQEARVIRACFVEGADLKPRQGWVYRDVARQEFQSGEIKKRFAYGGEAMAIIAKFKKLGIETAWMVAFIEGSGYAFVVNGLGDERGLDRYSSGSWGGSCLFLAVCE